MKKSKRFVRILTAAFTLAIAVMVAAPEVQAASVKSVEVSNLPAKTLTLKKGKSKTLKAKVTVSGKASKKVTWKSSNKKIVTVTSKGKVTAKKNGKAKVTVTSAANKKKKATITVTVGTPSTKVKLNKTSGSLYVGKSVTLKATVSPTKASNKKVVWTSSKTSVATVSSKGKVTAKKAGSATITATAADGSGKKATFKVKVLNPVTIAKVEAIDANAVQVTLSAAQALTKDNFAVKVKNSAAPNYVTSNKIERIETTNNKTYVLVLNEEISNGEMVQVNVAGLNGSGTLNAEALYIESPVSYQSTRIFTATVNQSVREEYGIDYTITGLPEGLKYSAESGYIYGKVSKAGRYTSQATDTDEWGNTYTYDIVWLIGDANTILAEAKEENKAIQRVDGNAWIYSCINIAGGSGDYTCEIVGESYGLEIDGKHLEGYLTQPNSYSVQIKVTDNDNLNLTVTTTVKINVIKGRTITGTVADNAGKAVKNGYVSFVSKDKTSKYPRYYEGSIEDGKFTALVPDGTYTVYAHNYEGSYYCEGDNCYVVDGFDETTGAYNIGETHLINYKITGDVTGLNIVLPYTQKIELEK